jgi:regulator of sirC expression with transglutaminase-like and TPR domain
VRRPVTHPLALERLADALRPPGNVFAGAVAIATHHDPKLRPGELGELLDRMAADVRRMIANDSVPFGVLRHVVFERFGFRGNHRKYHDPLNSYINAVLERKMGLPILLAVVFTEVAARAGIAAHGIGLPGHFVAATEIEGHRRYVDVFNGGRELSVEDCRNIALAASQFWAEGFLAPVTPAAWLERMLNNLQNAYRPMGDLANSAAVAEQMLLVNPQNDAAARELGELYGQMDRLRARDN